MKFLRNQKGFTLIELVMVIVILGILASVAIPKFSDISQKAEIAAEAGVVGAVRAGISAVYMTNMINSPGLATYPDSLDTAPKGQVNTPTVALNAFFTGVLSQGGVHDGNWYKKSSALAGTDTYIGKAGGQYSYYPDSILGTPNIDPGSFLRYQTNYVGTWPPTN